VSLRREEEALGKKTQLLRQCWKCTRIHRVIEKVPQIIVACAILHNLSLTLNQPQMQDDPIDFDNENLDPPEPPPNHLNITQALRDNFINTHFSNNN